jgi:hypothetical protein
MYSTEKRKIGVKCRLLMRYIRAGLVRLTANAKVATVLGSIPESSDTVESEGRQIKQCWNKVHNKQCRGNHKQVAFRTHRFFDCLVFFAQTPNTAPPKKKKKKMACGTISRRASPRLFLIDIWMGTPWRGGRQYGLFRVGTKLFIISQKFWWKFNFCNKLLQNIL